MTENISQESIGKFLDGLAKKGGASGNARLRTFLGWQEDEYWKIQGHLINERKIVAGRGRGGSVRLLEIKESEAPKNNLKEKDYYNDIFNSIKQKWINRFALDQVIVDETHSRGSKKTGGKFTRPDITAVGVKQYTYLPKTLEVITFEIKKKDDLNIMGVLEAIAHREASHKSYVIYVSSKETFENTEEFERIIDFSQKFGVGVVLADKAKDVDTWEIIVDATRNDPDPTKLDRFLHDLPSSDMKKQLSKWKGS